MALLKNSRYGALDRFDANSPFEGIKPRPTRPATPVLEHEVSMKERLDRLAQNYYSAPRAWVRIAETNLQRLHPEDLIWTVEPVAENGRERLGAVLLIPRREETRQ